MKKLLVLLLLSFLLLPAEALARRSLSVTPRKARPGDALLVKVTGPGEEPQGKAGGDTLRFFKVRGGWQAIASVPVEKAPEKLAITVEGGLEETVVVAPREFPEAEVDVEEEYANPPADARARIDADNQSIIAAFKGNDGPPRFTTRFRPPAPGKTTSTFGEWRTFNGDHRSQHLGLDVAAKEGAPVNAVNAGQVILVTDGYLTGKTVVVSHGAGIYSAYFHLQEVTVADGASVKRGAPVGRVGMTGRTTGPHVHVSVWVPGGYVDPATLFRLPVGPVVDAP